MGIILWALFGSLTGWLFDKYFKSEFGSKKAAFMGLVAGLTFGWIATLTTKLPTLTGLNLASFLVPVIGSFITIWVLNRLSKNELTLQFKEPFEVAELKEKILDTASTLLVKSKVRGQ